MNTQLNKLIGLTLATTLLSACGSEGSADVSTATSRQALTAEELGNTLNQGAQRVEIRLVPGTLIVEEIDVYGPASVDEEYIESPVEALADNGSSLELTLTLGGLVISVDTAAARFRTLSNSNATSADFVGEAQSGNVRLRRAAIMPSQDPADATFGVIDARIRTDSREKIELNVDADNFAGLGTESSSVTVLGLTLTIDASTGLFSSEGMDHPEDDDSSDDDDNGDDGDNGANDDNGAVDQFSATVLMADPTAGTLELASGEIVQITTATTVDPEGDLFSVAEAAAELADGFIVTAEGRFSTGGAPEAASIKLESNR